MTKEERRSYWADRIAEFKANGQSVPAWCAAHDIKIHQMRYWLKRDKTLPQKRHLPGCRWTLVTQGFKVHI